MSDSTISNLPEATTPLAGTEIVPVVQEGETRRVVLAPIAVSGSAADLEAGTVPSARLGSGTADGTTFLRGDGAWAVPPGGDGGGAPAVRDDGSTIVAVPVALNFTGGGVTVTDAGGSVAEIAIPAAAATDLTYTAATRVLASSTGTDATLPLVTSSDAGLAPASGGGTSNFLRADATWATPPAPGWTTVFKTADEVRTSTTTTAADNTLTLALDANSTYVVRIYALIQTENATMDYKFGVLYSGTTSSVMSRRRYRVAGVADSGTISFEVMNNTLPPDNGIAAGGTFGAAFVEVEAAIVTVNAGTLSFVWSQNTSDAAEIRVKAGSYLEYRKVA